MTSYRDKIQHPWQSGPTELIAHAIEHLHKHTDFDNRLAFLLFDVGVEILFKTFLLLPDKVTEAKNSFMDRRKATEGNFHILVQGIEQAKPAIIQKHNLAYVQFFHDTRNKLYHEGNGITVDVNKVNDYAHLAVNLLLDLLDVDLDDLLHFPELELKKEIQRQEKQDQIKAKKNNLQKSRAKLGELSKMAVELIAPHLTLSSFSRKLDKLYLESPQKAFTTLMQEINATFPTGKMKDRLSGYASIEDIIRDINLLYVIIAGMELDLGTSWGPYVASQYDPEAFMDDGTLTAEEFEKKVVLWLDETNSEIHSQIVTTEAWLSQQNI